MTKHTRIIETEFKRFLGETKETLRANPNGDRSRAPHLAEAVIEAATRRLRESMDTAETLEAIREIASNLLGCETMHLIRLDRETGVFHPFWSFGVEPANRCLINALEESASYCAALGSAYIARDLQDQSARGPHTKVTVFVPFRCQSEVTAVLVLLQFLPQKLGFDKIDNEIFRILSEEAGSKLFCREAGSVSSNIPEQKS